MKKTILLLFLTLLSYFSMAQRHTISGYVSDRNTGERLINANVYEQNSLKGSMANSFGFYSLSLPAGKSTIVASFIGYQPQMVELDLTKDHVVNFELNLKSDELEEVVVVGNRSNKVEETQMSMMDIPIQKLQKIPVILGEADVLKVIQLMPGVSGGTEGTSGIYVRGGGPDQNLFLLDGVPVYNAGHLLGFFSVFNPDALKTVKLYKGGFPARFGGRLSSVVDITMKDGNMKEFEGNFSIGLISSKLSLEGPIVKDQTSFIISARRTYLDLLTTPLLAIISKAEDTKIGGEAYFHDYNIKVNHIFNERSRLYASAYFGKDKGGIREEDTYEYSDAEYKRKFYYKDDFSLSWGNTIASLRWNYLLNQKLFSNTTLTYSKYIFDIEMLSINKDLIKNTRKDEMFRYYSGIEDWAAKVDFDYFPAPGHNVKFGAHFTNHHFTPGVTKFVFNNQEVNSKEVMDTTMGNRNVYANEISFYAENDITLSPRLNMNAGLHLSVFDVDDLAYMRLQPRLSLRYKGGENWSLKASYSRMAQHVHLLATAGIDLPTDLWLPVTKDFAPPISDQVAAGAAINLPFDLTLTIEGFYKTMQNLIEYKEGASFTGNATQWESKVEKGKGWSYGGEFMLEKTIGKTTGWIGYTLSWSERLFENLNFGKVFPFKYDRRHDISVVVTHQFSDKFDIGGSWVYGTGNAVTLALQKYPRYAIKDNNWWYSSDINNYESRNNFRMPDYHRLDIGCNFHKKKKYGIRTWSISFYNAYNRLNPFMLTWNTKSDFTYDQYGNYIKNSPDKTVLTQYSLFPIIPSVSYSYKF